MRPVTSLLRPTGRRLLTARSERAVLVAIILLLFVVDYRFGALHRLVALIQGAESTLGSVLFAVAFASWVGAFSFAFRRRVEMAQLMAAKTAAEAEAESAGITDRLTGLPNRTALMMELRRRLSLPDPAERAGAVIAIDIDRFKSLNDLNGHQYADRVLVEFADRLTMAVRGEDFVARVGPDEFHVLTRAVDADEAEMLARQLLQAVAMRLEDIDPPMPVTSDAGIALHGPTGAPLDVESLMRRADIALQAAKAKDTSIAVFVSEMEVMIRDRAELETALEAAIDGDQIEPHFQPVIDLASNRLSGFEVLARWTHPTRGPIPPSLFIPIAEETGMLSRMTTSVMRRACRAAKDWPADIKIAVNISPVDFKNPWLAQEILQILTEVGFPPQRLEIEITESALVVDHDQATQTLLSLKNQGISVALDDFGTGYASLHQLRMLPFDKIKIDQSFVRTMRENADSRMIVKAIIGLSGSLGLPTTAEGIETSSNADILRDYGCTLGQGFFYLQAVPATEVPRLLDVLEEKATVGYPARMEPTVMTARPSDWPIPPRATTISPAFVPPKPPGPAIPSTSFDDPRTIPPQPAPDELRRRA